MILPAFQLKKKQYLYAGLAALIGLILVGVLIASLGGDLALETSDSSPPQEIHITTAGQRISSQETWVERIESENKLTNEKLEDLKKVLTGHAQDLAKLIGQQKTCSQVQDLESEEEESEGNFLPSPPESSSKGQILPLPEEGSLSPSNELSSGIRKIVIKLSNRALSAPLEKAKVDLSTLENTLPAGTFAKAILLGGVDASTSISSPSDPRPVLLRITDQGSLPRRFKSDLKACHLLASCYGDLSSERVYMRLEKLTCTEQLTGEISETQVAGYVVGEDGKAGVRGIVIDKSGPLIRNSLVGGFFSGMSQLFGAQQQQSIFPISPFGQTQSLSTKQLFSAGASQGASNALEKYADFFIKRAEQLQPVLQVAAGREVDIVFTQGTLFGETSVRHSLRKIRDQSRKQALQHLEGQADSQNWLPDNPIDNPQEGDEP